MVGGQFRFGCRIPRLATDLRRVWTGSARILKSGRARARYLACVAVVGTIADGERHLRPITTDLLGGHEDVADMVGREAVGIGLVGLRALRDVPNAGVNTGRCGIDEA